MAFNEVQRRREKRKIEDATLVRPLNALLKASFVETRIDGRNVAYHVADPVLESVF